ncbi:hypothetical protein SASPL_102855 [Salvia splendens]|uniref:RPM1 interacting protein 13 n=1 Tax=Salvia splendens TaxID=180675 RepID=A0A8X9AED4_SALSN|nr:uncharacterized protein LOC121752825 isoform X1 [Salvia splendens]KAG6437924.1 hypothetical protein SASPL_102855 [Salvia splendens]
MENPAPIVLDISSDEETVFGDVSKGFGEFGYKEDGEWLSRLLVEVGGNIDDDSDDVVFVGELFPNATKKSRSDSVKVAIDDGDDDDCMVLDGDPDNPVVAVNHKDDGDDSDDLEIVGEKGEVACRDFPHPRHLCAKYHFATYRHEVHCGQCHCYVCDVLAPCLHWGTGFNSADHCHASDKEEFWKSERKRVKKIDKPVANRSTITACVESYFQSIQVPGCAPSQPHSLPQNQGVNPGTIRPCVQSSSVSMPNAMNRVRSQPPGRVASRYNPLSPLASVRSHSQPRSPYTLTPRVAPMNKSHPVGSQIPQSSHRPVFKRNGLIGASTNNNKHAHRSQLSGDPTLSRRRALQAAVTDVRRSQATVLSSRPNMDARHANYSSSNPRMNLQRLPNYSPVFTPHQSLTPSQPSVSGTSLGSPRLQPYTCTEPRAGNISKSAGPEPYITSVPDSHVPSQTVDSCHSDAGNTFLDQLHSRSTISSCSGPINDFAQPQKQSHPTSPLAYGQNDVQHQHLTQSGMGSSPADFGFFCDSSVNHGNMQIHAENGAPAETSQVQNIQDDQPSVTPLTVDNPPQQNTAYTSPMNDDVCQFPESGGPGSFDFHLLDSSWMFENQSFTGAVEAAASPNWNVYSPETAFADTGTLFDI